MDAGHFLFRVRRGGDKGEGVAYGVFGKFVNAFLGDAGGYNDGEDDR
jgi:hypothetical protein